MPLRGRLFLSSLFSGYCFHYFPIRELMWVKEEIEKGVDGRTAGWENGNMGGWGYEWMEKWENERIGECKVDEETERILKMVELENSSLLRRTKRFHDSNGYSYL